MYPGGFNGTAVAAFNQAGGGGTPSNGGYGSTQWDGGSNPAFISPQGGSALQGGNGGYNQGVSTWNQGAGGGGGWYGGGGSAAAGDIAPGAGGGSNYANALMLTNITYGTITATPTNNNGTNGSVTISW
jgi:hypothetical protein